METADWYKHGMQLNSSAACHWLDSVDTELPFVEDSVNTGLSLDESRRIERERNQIENGGDVD